MHFLSLIEAKRDGRTLCTREWRDFVTAYSNGELPDYQVAAFLMAIFFRGMSAAEIADLTLAMRNSGETLQFSQDRSRPIVDKHSTGGVGDKVSLPLAPLLAALGFRVPMISGRGLGITGGTLDKLESIPGFKTLLPREQILQIVETTGAVICGQTDRMVPADKGLYALRDVTGTVPSIPLIVASILSKKLAEGLEALVLDVKFGVAAFMPTLVEARTLGQAMVSLGNQCGVSCRALLTAMDFPLGRSAGNWLEVRESVECLTPGAEKTPDLRSLVVECAAHLLVQTGLEKDLTHARKRCIAVLETGQPLAKWEEMLRQQGADLPAYHRLLQQDHTSSAVFEVASDHPGIVHGCDARLMGEVVRDLGGGRMLKDAAIDPSVGVDAIIKPGEAVRSGDILCRVHASDLSKARDAGSRLKAAFRIEDQPPQRPSLVAEVIS